MTQYKACHPFTGQTNSAQVQPATWPHLESLRQVQIWCRLPDLPARVLHRLVLRERQQQRVRTRFCPNRCAWCDPLQRAACLRCGDCRNLRLCLWLSFFGICIIHSQNKWKRSKHDEMECREHDDITFEMPAPALIHMSPQHGHDPLQRASQHTPESAEASDNTIAASPGAGGGGSASGLVPSSMASVPPCISTGVCAQEPRGC